MSKKTNLNRIISYAMPAIHDSELAQLRPVLWAYGKAMGLEWACEHIFTILYTAVSMALEKELDDADVFYRTVKYISRQYRKKVAFADKSEKADIAVTLLSRLENRLLQHDPTYLAHLSDD